MYTFHCGRRYRARKQFNEACKDGNLDAVINSMAYIHLRDEISSFEYACAGKTPEHTKIVEFILNKYRNSIDTAEFPRLLNIAIDNNLSTARIFLEKGTDPKLPVPGNVNKWSPLAHACWYHNVPAVELLLSFCEKKYETTKGYLTNALNICLIAYPINHRTDECKCLEIFTALIMHGANVEEDVLVKVICTGHSLELIKLLIRGGANPYKVFVDDTSNAIQLVERMVQNEKITNWIDHRKIKEIHEYFETFKLKKIE